MAVPSWAACSSRFRRLRSVRWRSRVSDRGAVKPSSEAAARPDGTRLPGEGDEDVLGDFLCGWWIAKDAKGGAVHEIHVSTDEFGEGRFVVSSDVGFEELFVCGLTVLHGVGSKGF
jgi:hypothetical protein